MVFGALAAIVGADYGKMRPTQVDCGRPLGSRPLWTTKTNKIHGKVGAQAAYVLKHVDDWFLVLYWPFLGGLR